MKQILVIHGDSGILGSARKLFGSKYLVNTAGNLEEASLHLASQKYDLIISGLRYTNGDGLRSLPNKMRAERDRDFVDDKGFTKLTLKERGNIIKHNSDLPVVALLNAGIKEANLMAEGLKKSGIKVEYTFYEDDLKNKFQSRELVKEVDNLVNEELQIANADTKGR